MGLREIMGDTAIVQSAAGAGTYVSGPIAAAGIAQDVMLLVHQSAFTGTPTLNVSLEESTDGTSWTALSGSAITQIGAAVGSASANARPTKPYVRVTSTVAGTTPACTFRAVVLVIPG